VIFTGIFTLAVWGSQTPIVPIIAIIRFDDGDITQEIIGTNSNR
jgi:hypothetical protein